MSRRLHPMNKEVGLRVRERRLLLGLSQRQLADQIGVTFQQIQKYEKGTNRIDAARLVALSAALDINPEWLLRDGAASGRLHPEGGEAGEAESDATRRNALPLLRAYNRIRSADVRHRLLALIQALAEEQPAPPTTD